MTQPHIFISYSRQDSQVADKIVDALDSLGLPVWIDRREIMPGDSWIERVDQALSNSNYVLVLFSHKARESSNVSIEWQSALARQTTLIPILLENGAIPSLLQSIVYIDFASDISKGLESLQSFFRREFSSFPISSTTRRGSPPISLQAVSRRELRLVAQKCLNETIFLAFLWDEGIDKGEVEGSSFNSFNERLVRFLHYLGEEDRIEDFAIWLSRERRKCVESQLKQLRQTESNS
jgi:hypothetical protein